MEAAAIEPLACGRDARLSGSGFAKDTGGLAIVGLVNFEAGVDEVDVAAGLQDDILSMLLHFAPQNCKHSCFPKANFPNNKEELHLKQSKFCLRLRRHQPANLGTSTVFVEESSYHLNLRALYLGRQFPPHYDRSCVVIKKSTRKSEPSQP